MKYILYVCANESCVYDKVFSKCFKINPQQKKLKQRKTHNLFFKAKKIKPKKNSTYFSKKIIKATTPTN